MKSGTIGLTIIPATSKNATVTLNQCCELGVKGRLHILLWQTACRHDEECLGLDAVEVFDCRGYFFDRKDLKPQINFCVWTDVTVANGNANR